MNQLAILYIAIQAGLSCLYIVRSAEYFLNLAYSWIYMPITFKCLATSATPENKTKIKTCCEMQKKYTMKITYTKEDMNK